MSQKVFPIVGTIFMGMAALAATGQAAAEVRPEVVERISPIGKVVVAEQPAKQGGAAPAAASAPAPAPAAAAPAPAPAAAPAAGGGSEGGQLYAAKGCAACHGPNGRKTTMSVYPKIAGQGSAYLVAQMKDIKSGKRNNGQSMIMKGIIAQVSDAEMKAIADWLATQ